MNKLYPFQQEGVKFLLAAPHRLLADEMGLGKSIQTVEAISQAGLCRVLVICPAIIKETWKQHFEEWTTFDERSIQILDTRSDIVSNKSIIITNYELLYTPGTVLKQLHKLKFDLVVIDESQRIKEVRAKITRILLAKQGRRPPLVSIAKRVWLLTGTPLPNRPIELYPIAKTLFPSAIEPYIDYDAYGRYYCNGFETQYGYDYNGASHIDELKKGFAKHMLRRTIDEVYSQLPEKIISTVYCPVPTLGDMNETNTPIATMRQAVGKHKIPFVVDFVAEKLNAGEHKIVVFGYSREVIEGIANHDKLQKYEPVYIYGGMTNTDKQFALNYFTTDIRCKILIVQITSAGTGIDGLQKVCNIMVGAEPEWSNHLFKQVIGRIHRIGQTNICKIYLILAKNSLDGKIYGNYNKKELVIKEFLNNDVRIGIKENRRSA